jgi:hypothetical protein
MYKKIGMHLLEMDAVAHDLHVAYVSHISHITSFALANTVLEKEKKTMQFLSWPQRVSRVQCGWQKVIHLCGFPSLCRTGKMCWTF